MASMARPAHPCFETWHASQAKTEQRMASMACQRTPRPETRRACQAKTFIRGFEFGCLGGAVGNVIGKEIIFGSQEEADVSWYPARPPHAHKTQVDGTGLRSALMLVQLLCPGPGSSLDDEIELLLRMIPACRWLSSELNNSNCNKFAMQS
eukprot:1142832-Pelagomonas_calceolata.AAC.9